MAWARVQSKSTTSAGAVASVAATLGSTPSAGNKLVALVVLVSSTSVVTSTVKDANAVAMTQMAVINNAGNCNLSLWAMDVPGTPNAVITATGASGTNEMAILVQEVSGLLVGNTTAMGDGTFGTKSGSTSPTGIATYSSTAANEYLVTCFGDFGNSVNATGPLGNVDANNINSSANDNCQISYGNSTSGSETAATWAYTPTTGDQWGIITGAFKLAAGGVVGIPDLVMAPMRGN